MHKRWTKAHSPNGNLCFVWRRLWHQHAQWFGSSAAQESDACIKLKSLHILMEKSSFIMSHYASLQALPTSTRGRSTGSSTISCFAWSPATRGPSWGTSWAATACLLTTTGTGAPRRRRNATTTTATLMSWSNWTAQGAQRKQWPSPSPVYWRCAWWSSSTLYSSSGGRAHSATYCTASAPCRSGSEGLCALYREECEALIKVQSLLERPK